jgi:hypothetical protein
MEELKASASAPTPHDDRGEQRSLSIAEACELLVDLTRKLARARADRDVWRQMCLTAAERLHQQHTEITKLKSSMRRVLEQLRELRGSTPSALKDRPCA